MILFSFQEFILELFESDFHKFAYEIILKILSLKDNSYWLFKVSFNLYCGIIVLNWITHPRCVFPIKKLLKLFCLFFPRLKFLTYFLLSTSGLFCYLFTTQTLRR